MSFRLLLFSLLASSFGALVSEAQVVWTGGGGANMNWSDPSNWTPGLPPNDGSAIIVYSTASSFTSVVDTSYSATDLEVTTTAGALVLNNSGGSGLTLSGGFFYGGPNAVTINVPITGTGNFWFNGGSGTVTLTAPTPGANTFSGSTKVDGGGTLNDGAADSLSANSDLFVGGSPSAGVVNLGFDETINTLGDVVGGNGVVNLSNGATLTIASGGNLYSGIIAGNGNLGRTGTGTQRLTGANTYTGTTTIGSGATLQLGDGTTNGSINGSSGVSGSGTLAFDYNGTVPFAVPIGGSLGIEQVGGITVLGAGNTNSGTTLLNGGALVVDNASGVGTGTGAIVISGGILEVGNTDTNGTINTNAILDNSLLEIARTDSVTFPNSISGSGGLEFSGAGTGVFTLTGNNTYTGTTNVFASTVRPGTSTSLGNGSDFTLSTSTLDLNGHDISLGSLSSDSASSVLLGGNTLILTDTTSSNFGGSMTGSGSLVLNGAGEFFILGAVSYTGGTTIGTSGYLSLGANSGPGASMVGNVLDNGMFQMAPFSSDNYLFAGPITGTGLVRIVGSGIVTLESVGNTYSGITDVQSATLTDGIADAFSPNSEVFVSTGATVAVTQNEVVGGLLNGSGAGVVNIATGMTLESLGNGYVNDFQSAIGGGGMINVSAGMQGFSGNNTYTGGTLISGTGEIFVGSNTALGTGTLTFNGSDTELSPDQNVTLANNIVLDSTFDNDDGASNNLTLTGVISGPAEIEWCAPGTLTLTNSSNGFTGGIDMREGTLVVGATGATGSPGSTVTLAGNANSGLTVMSGVNFPNPISFSGSGNILSGNGTISSPAITVNGAVVLAPSASPGGGPGNLTFTNGLTLASGGTFNFSLYDATGSPGTGFGLVTVGGPLTVSATPSSITFNVLSVNASGGAANAINFNPANSYSWTFATSSALSGFNGNEFNIVRSSFSNTMGGMFTVTGNSTDLILNFSPVPEPSTWAMLGAGLLACVPVAVRKGRAGRA